MSYTPYEIVKLARDNSRPTGLDYIRHIFSCLLYTSDAADEL